MSYYNNYYDDYYYRETYEERQLSFLDGKGKMIYYKYKKFLAENGANMSLFDNRIILREIAHIISSSNIKDGDSPILFKFPNKDGTFDIVERSKENYIKSYHKMSIKNGRLCLTEYRINNIDSLTGSANIIRSKEIDGGEMQFYNEKLLLGDYPYDSLESIINDKEINCEENYVDYNEHIQYLYNRYEKFIIDNGGDPELFSFRCIKEIINKLIKYSVLKKDINNYSPIYYKLPNDDGTFDICGSKNGKDIDVCYKMTRFSEFILLTEYRIESIDSNTKRANISMKKYIIDNLHKDSSSPNTIEDKIILPGDYPCDKLINIIQEKQMQLEEDYKIIFNIFNNYKNYIKNNGGNTKYFDFYEIQEILINIIKNGNLSEIIEGRSPIYYKLPNDNGSFDICGSKNGKYIDIYYDMFLLYPDTFVTMYKIESIDSKTGRVTISEYHFTIDKNGGTWSVHKPEILPGDYPIDALNDIKEFEKAKKETGRTLKL